MAGENRKFPLFMSGSYGVGWEDLTLPEDADNLLVVAYNSDEDETRIYAYTNSVWWYVDLGEV